MYENLVVFHDDAVWLKKCLKGFFRWQLFSQNVHAPHAPARCRSPVLWLAMAKLFALMLVLQGIPMVSHVTEADPAAVLVVTDQCEGAFKIACAIDVFLC